ncbi:hypothetical protein [Campylobacter hyointestinalis]|uniref:hypothetical protein n=1 Tax=Campylobacter hyointestinalis TaxID=198 RepID=UPI000DCD1AC3|nr:hypothetical protein [Campylobacter hyointestinalis]RAZ39112.1 hypothetical protein CHL9426_04145 [Campylobacter hyointestinalis subsp. lawsonii]RAZ50949.1 hypothetical protein CHL10075_09220 [Campylobacter hyointestinalis subsp. lawsonii]
MQNLTIDSIDKNIKSLNIKRKQILSLQVKIKNEKLHYEKELNKLTKEHKKKLTNLSKKYDELNEFFAKLNERISNSSPCGDGLASDTLTK